MTAENYLLSMYRLREEGAVVTLTQLAEHLKMLPEGEGLGTSLPTARGIFTIFTLLFHIVSQGLIKRPPALVRRLNR